MNAIVKAIPDYYMEANLAILEVLQNLLSEKIDEIMSLQVSERVHITCTDKDIHVVINEHGSTFYALTHNRFNNYHADYKISCLKHDIAHLNKQIKDLKDFWLIDRKTQVV